MRWLLAFLLMTTVRAERYLTLREAQKLCFPAADRFEEKTLRFSREQRQAIERASGVPVRTEGLRLVYAFGGEKLAGLLLLDHVLGKHEIIDYAVAISPAGTILQVEILEYRESHGGEIRQSRWRRQFAGKNHTSPLRLNEDIYNISGATMSCRHVTQGIKRLLATFELVGRAQPPLAGVPDGVSDTPAAGAPAAGR